MKKILFILFLMYYININSWFWFKTEKTHNKLNKSKILILDPAEHKSNERMIKNHTQYEISLYFCQLLQVILDNNQWKILISKTQPNITNIAVASWANKLKANLLININFYPIYDNIPQIDIFYTGFNYITDFWKSNDNSINFVQYDTIYKKHIRQTKTYAIELFKELQKYKVLNCSAPMGVPLKMILGVDSSAITIDIGITDENNLDLILEPLSESIKLIMNLQI